MKLAIVGSVSIDEIKASKIIYAVLERFKPECVISGGAYGVDFLAETAALELGYNEEDGSLVVHVPKSHRWAPAGFQERNILIAEECTHLLAIRSKTSTTYGSGWTADYAERKGKKVIRVELS